jgi:hypothetical protein
MIRVLILIAATGFLVSVIALSSAFAIVGPDAISHGAWSFGRHNDWNWDDDDHGRPGRNWTSGSGPQTTREIAWSGGDLLEIDVPADVRFTQAPGPGKLVITGPQGSVERVEVEDGRIHFDRRVHNGGRMTIVMSAPDVSRFDIGGANRLTIEGYSKDRLEVELSGSSEVTAKGVAKTVELDIGGSGEADLGGVAAEGADVDISGSGEAIIAPKDWATLDISGSGEVHLLTNPPRLETDISGSGRIRQGQRPASVAPSPPVPGQKL